MGNRLYVGQKLSTLTDETVIIKDITTSMICVEYKGKNFWRDRTIIGNKLFIISEAPYEPDSMIAPQVSKGQHKPAYNCNDCMLMRRQDCFGEKKICKYFQRAVNVSKEEMDAWPKFGDATYYRMTSKRK